MIPTSYELQTQASATVVKQMQAKRTLKSIPTFLIGALRLYALTDCIFDDLVYKRAGQHASW